MYIYLAPLQTLSGNLARTFRFRCNRSSTRYIYLVLDQAAFIN
jgi:hypothetical protein